MPEYNEEDNKRRSELIDKEINQTISKHERAELEILQKQFLRHRQTVAPLPLDELRKLHQDLQELKYKSQNPPPQ